MKYTNRKHSWGMLGASENLVMQDVRELLGIEKESETTTVYNQITSTIFTPWGGTLLSMWP